MFEDEEAGSVRDSSGIIPGWETLWRTPADPARAGHLGMGDAAPSRERSRVPSWLLAPGLVLTHMRLSHLEWRCLHNPDRQLASCSVTPLLDLLVGYVLPKCPAASR